MPEGGYILGSSVNQTKNGWSWPDDPWITDYRIPGSICKRFVRNGLFVFFSNLPYPKDRILWFLGMDFFCLLNG